MAVEIGARVGTNRSRRHKGEGSMYQRKDGRWVGVVDLGVINKKRVRKTVTAATLKELRPKFKALQASIAAGVMSDDATVDQWMEHWLDTVAAEHVRPSTLRNYRGMHRNWVSPHLGHMRLDRVRPEHLRVLYAEMKAQEKADNYRHHVHTMLRGAFSVAVDDGRLLFSPVERTKAPPLGTKTHGKLTLPEARTLLDFLGGVVDGEKVHEEHPQAARWTVALLAGLRQGEALGLAWHDVDFERNLLHIERAAQRIKGRGVVTVPPKSKAGTRVVPMLTPVRYALENMDGKREGFVFGGLEKPMDPKTDWEHWRDLLKAAGLPHVPLHAARATTASLLSEAGVPPKIIAEIMGHAQVSTTERHYIHGDERVHVNAMAAMETLVLGR